MPVGRVTWNILSKTASHAPKSQNSPFLDLFMGLILARASAWVLGPTAWEWDLLRPWMGASGGEVLQNTELKWAQQNSLIQGAELNWNVNKPFHYFPNGSCHIQTACYTSTAWRWKKYMKKTNLVAEGRYLALSIPLPSPPSWLLVWSPASPTSAPLCIVAPFAARAPCPGTGDRVGQDLLVSFPLHSPKITPELHEELWTSYHLPLFPYCSLPCTIFNFKVFLHYLKCNLWVFNQVTKLFQELQKKTDKYTSRLSPRQLSGTHSNRMLIIMLKS